MKKVRRFLVVIEKAKRNYAAYSPDLPGCIATGSTRVQAERNMQRAITMHIEGLHEDDIPVPRPSAVAEYVTIET